MDFWWRQILQRAIYSSKTLSAWLAVFGACEIAFVYFFVIELACHHRRAAAGVIALNVPFSVGVLLMFRDPRGHLAFVMKPTGQHGYVDLDRVWSSALLKIRSSLFVGAGWKSC